MQNFCNLLNRIFDVRLPETAKCENVSLLIYSLMAFSDPLGKYIFGNNKLKDRLDFF